mgnify:CR=1 FL=1|jgi:hypothetical protein|tara:strand:- start:47 stop:325 length:279 start_codon:yes stop_codon:yes gene_type:complete
MMDNWSDDDIKNGFEFLDSMEEISTTVKEIKVLNEAVKMAKESNKNVDNDALLEGLSETLERSIEKFETLENMSKFFIGLYQNTMLLGYDYE